ncbi:MAG: dihydrolipoyllysine-residue acetyltransferase [Gammaproteobacteria bacterium]|nr:dihydrolipoyllysine-residue acetyltransferase [Gammaproteobacteria bacterium]
MANAMREVTVPDIGDFNEVEVIDVLVAQGDTVAAEDPILTLESDKATMDIPAPFAGRIAELKVKVGDKVSQGTLIALLEAAGDTASAPTTAEAAPAPVAAPAAAPAAPAQSAPAPAAGASQPVVVPDIGDFDSVEVIEVHIKPGDTLNAEDPVVTLESDKATMDVPCPVSGTIGEVSVKVGDRVAKGSVLATISGGAAAPAAVAAPAPAPAAPAPAPSAAAAPAPKPAPAAPAAPAPKGTPAHASPSVRKHARELGVEIGAVPGTGRKGRIQREDVNNYVKGIVQAHTSGAAPAAAASGGGFALPAMPAVDFSVFGPIETRALNKIKRSTGQNMSRNWLTVPHVTQFNEADITDLEAFRVARKKEADKAGVKLTMIAFLMKAAVAALRKYPDFNSSLSPDGASLILKQYFHIGVAVNTEHGLVVPVIRDVDKKGLFDLARDLGVASEKARARKLSMEDMSGGCFTISSLGGVGGTQFTPIVNAPEVAILGVSRSSMKPVWENGQFVPRLMLPFSLSYDHRVVDGVAGAMFTEYLREALSDMRNILL